MQWSYSQNSLFDLPLGLSTGENIINLRNHHRSHADIISFSNQFFYGENLRVATNHQDLMPMSIDILKYEHFLTPGTIILIDGRTANARFLKLNLQRNWLYKHDVKNDQSIFYLQEKPLGQFNKLQLNFYNNKKI